MELNYTQRKEFVEHLINYEMLDEAIIYIQAKFNPEDVFSEEELNDWAVNNGYIKP